MAYTLQCWISPCCNETPILQSLS